MKKTGESDDFSEVEHKHGDRVTSIQHARVNTSIIYVTRHERKAPINKLSRRKAPINKLSRRKTPKM